MKPLTQKQWDRNSLTHVRGILALPNVAAQAFQLASALGDTKRRDGADRPIDYSSEGGKPLVVVVGKLTRDRVKGLLRLKKKTWERRVSAWVAANMAHCCERGIVCLYFAPENSCPWCELRRRLEATSPVPSRDISRREFVPLQEIAAKDEQEVADIAVKDQLIRAFGSFAQASLAAREIFGVWWLADLTRDQAEELIARAPSYSFEKALADVSAVDQVEAADELV